MKFCTKCGAQLKDDAQFCKKCGAKCWEQDMAEAINEPPRIEKKPDKKKSRLPIIIGAAAVVVIAAVVVLIVKKGPGAQKNEANETIAASAETTTQESMDNAGAEKEINEVEGEKTDTAVLKDITPDSFVKYWIGSQHWGYEITKEPDGTYKAVLHTYDASREYTTETMYCTFNNDRLEYKGAVLERELYSFDSSWNDTAKVTEYTNGQGYFELLGGVTSPGSNEFFETTEESTTVLGGDVFDEESMKPPYLAHTYKKTPCASDEYMIWYSDQIPITEEDLFNMDATDLRIARNEIFARHGRLFKDEELQKHFNKCSWYEGTINPNQFNDSVLSKVEKNNIKVIENYEANTDLSAFVKWENSVDDCFKKYGSNTDKYGLTVSSPEGAELIDKGGYYEIPFAELFIYEPPIPESMFVGKGPGDAITWLGNTYIIESKHDDGYSFVENPGVDSYYWAQKVDGGYRLMGDSDWSPKSTVYYGDVKFDKECIIHGYNGKIQSSIEDYAVTDHSYSENRFEQGFEYGLTEGRLVIYGRIISMKDGLITEFEEVYVP